MKNPWTDGAKAYHEATSIKDIFDNLGRKRNRFTVIINHDQANPPLDIPCAVCGIPLNAPYELNKGEGATRTDTYAFVDVKPKTRQYSASHYYCAWASCLVGSLIFQAYDV